MKIKWLFFDVGSTLVDESKCYEARFKKIAEDAGVLAEAVTDKALELYRQNERGDIGAAEAFGSELPKWRAELEFLYDDTEVLLRQLSEKYKIGVIANQSLGTADRLEAFGILRYIDLVVASAEEGVAKPDRRIFEIALERAGCEPGDAMMIGDRIDNDILPAKNIGMRTMWVRQGLGGMWKLGGEEELPDFIADNVLEIGSILEWWEESHSLLETTLNTRDLGGHPCYDGSVTKFRRFIRSSRQAYPSKKDIDFLLDNNISTIIDVREEKSVKAKPSGFLGLEGFKYFNFPIEEGSQVPESVEAVPGSYMIISEASVLKDVFTTMGNADAGVMFNCSAGKDRTGVISAILLMLAGVKDEEIDLDYMQTKECNKEMLKLAAAHHPDLDLNIIIPRESYIIDFMKLFRQKYGTVEAYFKSIGVEDEIVEKLRNKMLSE
jgi:haloacid dehalogenase superfamily, subfamily IA, variant 3 with third motif having DD or ED/haloacid dehalogenase superfamily, subfamily IA, variant 1 with third motif having Dx(3-4)D or Dx(3-4)E